MKLSINGIKFSYGSREILKDVSFEVEEGEIFSILGTNGAGKSTLLKCINRILTPKKGTILIDNFDIRKMDNSQ
ncbi:MAG TPA: ABC transporter ATP-binding protein, partial [Methanothermococcus okinawensis]|nr:ABC transporter ATP-binding protein [Methanothermococcus okinawensis]